MFPNHFLTTQLIPTNVRVQTRKGIGCSPFYVFQCRTSKTRICLSALSPSALSPIMKSLYPSVITTLICCRTLSSIPAGKGIIVRNKLDLILRLIYSSAVWFLKYLKQINLDISAAEKELERSIRNEDLLRLMRLQKTLVYFNTSIRGNEVMIGKLKTIFQDTDYLDKELVEDVIIELKQALNTVNIYSDILTGTMDAFASIISNNVNTIMKRMTSLSIVLMLPTLIASFYGMNVDIHLEEVPFAFSLIVLFSIGLSTLAFVIFRKIKWF